MATRSVSGRWIAGSRPRRCCRDARHRSPGAVPRGHAQGAAEAARGSCWPSRGRRRARGGREAPAKGRGTICLRPEPGSRREGTGDTPAEAQAVMEASRATLGDDPQSETCDEARRRSRPGPRPHGARHVEVAEKEATFPYRLRRDKLRRLAARRSLPVANQSHGNGSREAVALLYPARHSGGGVQEPQGGLAIRPIYHQLEKRIEAQSLSRSSRIACTSR